MPRGRGVKINKGNPMVTTLAKKVMESMCQTEKVETATQDNFKKIFENSPESQDLLQELVADTISTFRLDHTLVPKPILVAPPVAFDKRHTNFLPNYTENTLTRVVVLAGSHEIFYPEKLSSKIPDIGIFVYQGSAFKVSPQHGNFTYDNSTLYSTDKYPGRGFKRPESRFLVVIDFICNDSEKLEAHRAEEIQKAGSKLSNPGLIDNFLKLLGK